LKGILFFVISDTGDMTDACSILIIGLLSNTQKKEAANPYEKLVDLPSYRTDGISSQKTVTFIYLKLL
jgi:hypothetical protein